MQNTERLELAGHEYALRQQPAGESSDPDDDFIEQRTPPRPRRSRRRRMMVQHETDTDHDYAGHSGPSSAAARLVDVAQEPEEDVEPVQQPANEEPAELEEEAAGSGANANEPPPDPGPSAPPSVSVASPSVSRPRTSAAIVSPRDESVVDLTATTTPAKKRKRLSKSGTPKVKSAAAAQNVTVEDEEDEGLTCPICLDHWEMSGEHRLVSLRCGHLFGDACIRRWLAESMRQSGIKACPQCKAKATAKEIRCLYAKRLRAIDRSEEHQLRDHLDEERRRAATLQAELATMRMSYAMVTTRIQTLEAENERMQQLWRLGGNSAATGEVYSTELRADAQLLKRLQHYKLSMERNIEIAREAGCRVMVYAEQNSAMIVSQKNTQSMFPGYGLRFIDTPTFRPTNFVHASGKLLRDICLSADQQLVAVTSMETRSKVFDLRTPQAAAIVLTPGSALWSCAMDRHQREHFIYLGSQHGSTYVYDYRNSESILEEFKIEGDCSPVINLATVPANKIFPGGGFLVCKLQSLWFYEYSIATNTTVPTRLHVEGPFVSLNFDAVQETLLITVRNSARYPQSRYLLGKLEKYNELPVFDVRAQFCGSKTTPVMTRSSQIAVEENTLVAGYIQDAKLLTLFDAQRKARLQSLPVQEVVFDICPVYTPTITYLAALTETKCRIYKLTATAP